MIDLNILIDYKCNEILNSEVYNSLKRELKPNPNNWIIVDKWNYRVFKKYEVKLYKLIENYLNKSIEKRIKDAFENFVDINELDIGDAATG